MVNIRQMRMFYLYFQQIEIQQTLSGESQKSAYNSPKHSHYHGRRMSASCLLKCRCPHFFMKETLRNGWSKLNRQIATQFYERTLLSRDKSAMLQKAVPTEPEVLPEKAIRDPFILEMSIQNRILKRR